MNKKLLLVLIPLLAISCKPKSEEIEPLIPTDYDNFVSLIKDSADCLLPVSAIETLHYEENKTNTEIIGEASGKVTEDCQASYTFSEGDDDANPVGTISLNCLSPRHLTSDTYLFEDDFLSSYGTEGCTYYFYVEPLRFVFESNDTYVGEEYSRVSKTVHDFTFDENGWCTKHSYIQKATIYLNGDNTKRAYTYRAHISSFTYTY